MAPEPTRIAILGLDHWYTAIPLAREVFRRPETELAGIWDADNARAREVAGQLGDVPVATSADSLLSDSSIAAVGSFVNTAENPRICVAAAEAGKHVISVKPLARTLDEATEVVRAVRRAEVVFQPAECRPRGSALAKQLQGWVQEGHFGRPLTASYSLWAGLPQGWPGDAKPGWFAERDKAPGGAWFDHSIYHIDMLRWLFETRVTRVSGTAANLKYPELPVEDYGIAIVEFDNGMIATIEDTWTAPSGGGRSQMSLIGTDAGVVQDSLSGRLSLSGSLQPFGGWAHIERPATHTDGLDDLLGGIRGELDPQGTVEDAWDNLAAGLAFYQSAASGAPVTPARLH